MYIRAGVYDRNEELVARVACPISLEEVCKEYGEDCKLDWYMCDYDWFSDTINRYGVEFANELSKYDPQELLGMYYDEHPEQEFHRMGELEAFMKANSDLEKSKYFWESDDYFQVSETGKINSFKEYEMFDCEKRYMIKMAISACANKKER